MATDTVKGKVTVTLTSTDGKAPRIFGKIIGRFDDGPEIKLFDKDQHHNVVVEIMSHIPLENYGKVEGPENSAYFKVTVDLSNYNGNDFPATEVAHGYATFQVMNPPMDKQHISGAHGSVNVELDWN